MPRLVITKGPGIGRDHAIGTECVLGRAPDVDFTVEDTNASRRHSRVLAEGDGYVIEDLGSRNGTWVNGARVVQRQALRDGDVVRIGGTEMIFRQKGLLETPPPARPQTPSVPQVPVPPAVAAAPARPGVPVRPAAIVPPVVPGAAGRAPVPVRPAAAVPPVVSAPRQVPVAPAAPAAPAAPSNPPKRPAVSPNPVRRRRSAW